MAKPSTRYAVLKQIGVPKFRLEVLGARAVAGTDCLCVCFIQVEVKPDMVGHYLAEFSISYKPVKHGKPGIGATHSSRFIPLK